MVAVIGDIHGCFHTLKNLVEKIRAKYKEIEIFSVGDLVDRGYFSYEVVEYAKKENIKFTIGNHDYMMYHFINHPTSDAGKPWLYNGYETTLLSYGKHFDKLNEHLEFIISHPLFFNLDDCFISHAGISKHMKKYLTKDLFSDLSKLTEVLKSNLNTEEGILWTRDPLLNIGKLQVIGHSINRDVVHSEKYNAVYIDTGAFLGNKLSAVIVEYNIIVEIIEEKTHQIDILESQ